MSNPLHRPGLINSIFLEGHGRGREWLFANARRTSYSQARHAAQCNHQPDRGGRQSGPQQPRHHHARQGAERGALVSHARSRFAGTLGIGLQTVTGKWKVEGGGRGIEGRERVLAMNPRRTDFAVVNAGQRTRALVFRRQPQTRLNGALHVVRVAVQYGVMFDRQGIFNGAWREPGRFVHGPGSGNTYGAKATDCLR